MGHHNAGMPSDPFYQSPHWRNLRREHLAANPSCAVPGCAKRATHVDHVISRRREPSRALDRTNLQSLCHSHHSEKTGRHDGGFGHRTSAPAPLRARGCDASGNPVDPFHDWNAK